MKSIENIEDCKEVQEKIKFDKNDDMSLLIKKKLTKISTDKGTDFKNNYKNYQYDYEEDLYEPRY